MAKGKGSANTALKQEEIRQIICRELDSIGCNGKKILVLLPDSTRTCPTPMVFNAISSHLKGKTKKLDFLIALGTHQPMNEEAIARLVGATKTERESKYGHVQIFNHLWKDANTLKNIGIISEEYVEKATDGLFRTSINVEINRMIFEYDHVIICGPVFPHEVVGFSGGFKYLFPGICGSEFLNFFHWAAALITNPKIIGTKDTPVRELINIAAKFVTVPVHALCMVVHHEQLYGLYTGEPQDAWSHAADLAAQLHIVTVDRSYPKILSCAPAMYDDLWTGGKCMYKMENAVADNGELIIYAPHITEISYTHGRVLDEVGYHVRDYFRKQWNKFKHHPWGVLAHSTHVRGIGTYENGLEKCRIKVTLATSIPEERCRKVNLGYLDPNSIKIPEWKNREHEGILVVPKAGEVLYRLKNPPEWSRL